MRTYGNAGRTNSKARCISCCVRTSLCRCRTMKHFRDNVAVWCRNVACVQSCPRPLPNLHYEHGPLPLARSVLIESYSIHTLQNHGAYYCKQWQCAHNLGIDALSHRVTQTNTALPPSQNCTTSNLTRINASYSQLTHAEPSTFIL